MLCCAVLHGATTGLCCVHLSCNLLRAVRCEVHTRAVLFVVDPLTYLHTTDRLRRLQAVHFLPCTTVLDSPFHRPHTVLQVDHIWCRCNEPPPYQAPGTRSTAPDRTICWLVVISTSAPWCRHAGCRRQCLPSTAVCCSFHFIHSVRCCVVFAFPWFVVALMVVEGGMQRRGEVCLCHGQADCGLC